MDKGFGGKGGWRAVRLAAVTILVAAGLASWARPSSQELVDQVRRLGDGDAKVRDAAAEELRQAGEGAVPALMEGLRRCGPLARWQALKLLGEKKAREAVPEYLGILRSDDYRFVKRAAAVALARSKAPEARGALLAYLEEDPVVGAESLGILGDPSVVPDLLGVLVDANRRMLEFRKKPRTKGDTAEFRAEEGRRAGDLAVLAVALLRLGCRGAVPTLLDTLKFSAWVGPYARKAFKEYLGDEMPPVMPPPGVKDRRKRNLAAFGAIARFWDTRFDVYSNPRDGDPVPDAAAERYRAMLRELLGADRDRKGELTEILVLAGSPVIPLLLEALGEHPDDQALLDTLYLMGRPPRWRRKPRVTRRVFDVVEKAWEGLGAPVKAALLGVVADWIHPDIYAREVQAQYLPEGVYRELMDRKKRATDLILASLGSESHQVRLAGLRAMRRLGAEEFVEPVLAHLNGTKDVDERVAAIRVLEMIRGATGAPAGKAALEGAGLLEESQPLKVRVQAAKSLGFVGDLAGMPVLLTALDAKDRDLRASAVDALRAIADRYYGYRVDASEDTRNTAAARWKDWWDKNAETYRVTVQRVREKEILANFPRMRRREMDDGWWAIASATTMEKRLLAEKQFNFHQNQFFPYLVTHFAQAPYDARPIFANLMASRFDRRYTLPLFCENLIHDEDPRLQIVVLDTLGLMSELHLDAVEAGVLREFVGGVLRDETEEPMVRIQAARALGRLGSADGIPYLIASLKLEADALEDAAWHRDEAYAALRELTVKANVRPPAGFDTNAPRSERRDAAERWAKWWDGVRDGFVLSPAGSGG